MRRRVGVLAVVVAMAGCGRGKNVVTDAAASRDCSAAQECLAAAPRFRWNYKVCENTTPGHPLASPDPERLPFYVDQVIVFLARGTTLPQVEAIAASVGGRVLSLMSPYDFALLEVPAKTVDEVVAVCRQLKRQPHVEGAMAHHFATGHRHHVRE